VEGLLEDADFVEKHGKGMSRLSPTNTLSDLSCKNLPDYMLSLWMKTRGANLKPQVSLRFPVGPPNTKHTASNSVDLTPLHH
jgi:hypothetical protein